ncbi:hypothetical protein ABPG77_000987 [Micractinium sp. CCAP 211/92]
MSERSCTKSYQGASSSRGGVRGEENDNLRSNTLEERVGNLEAIQRAAHNCQVATDALDLSAGMQSRLQNPSMNKRLTTLLYEHMQQKGMYAEPSDFDTIIRKGTGFTGTVDDMYAEYPDLALVVAKA